MATPKQRSELARLKKAMRAALSGELRGWDAYWEAVGEILARRLFLLDGADTAAAWLRAHVDEPLRTALRNVRVAQSASPEEEQRYTQSKIDLAIALHDAALAAEAKRKGVPYEPPPGPRKIDFAALRYEVTRAGKKRRVDLEKVTVPELRALLRAAGRRGKTTRALVGPTANAIAEALAQSPGLEGLSVQERDAMIYLGAFRADQVQQVGRALAKVKSARSSPPARG